MDDYPEFNTRARPVAAGIVVIAALVASALIIGALAYGLWLAVA